MLNDPHGIRVCMFERNMKQALRHMSRYCNKTKNQSEWLHIMEDHMSRYMKRWDVWREPEPMKILSFEQDGTVTEKLCTNMWTDPNFFDHMLTMGKFNNYDTTGAHLSFMHPAYPEKYVRLRYRYPEKRVIMEIEDIIK